MIYTEPPLAPCQLEEKNKTNAEVIFLSIKA